MRHLCSRIVLFVASAERAAPMVVQLLGALPTHEPAAFAPPQKAQLPPRRADARRRRRRRRHLRRRRATDGLPPRRRARARPPRAAHRAAAAAPRPRDRPLRIDRRARLDAHRPRDARPPPRRPPRTSPRRRARRSGAAGDAAGARRPRRRPRRGRRRRRADGVGRGMPRVGDGRRAAARPRGGDKKAYDRSCWRPADRLPSVTPTAENLLVAACQVLGEAAEGAVGLNRSVRTRRPLRRCRTRRRSVRGGAVLVHARACSRARCRSSAPSSSAASVPRVCPRQRGGPGKGREAVFPAAPDTSVTDV